MRNRVKVLTQVKVLPEEERPEKETCHHFWKIEQASGPTSVGLCKYCGATKEFYNSLPVSMGLGWYRKVLDLPELPNVKVGEESKS